MKVEFDILQLDCAHPTIAFHGGNRQHCRLSTFTFFIDTESETNPNNNLMMRRAGLSKQIVIGFVTQVRPGKLMTIIDENADFDDLPTNI